MIGRGFEYGFGGTIGVMIGLLVWGVLNVVALVGATMTGLFLLFIILSLAGFGLSAHV